MIELEKIDIITKVLLFSSHVALPSEGCSDATVHTMVPVGQRYNSRLVHYPLYPEIDHNGFKKFDWSEFYHDAKEAIPVNSPEPQGKEVNTCMFVDSDYAGDKVS